MVAFGLLPLGPACRPPPSTPDDLAQASTNENTALGPGDGFEVAVFGEAELSHAYRVARDGTIDFPLVGRIEVAGLEPPRSPTGSRLASGTSASSCARTSRSR